MKGNHYTTTFLVNAEPAVVFEIISNVKQWWTGEPGVEGSYNRIGDEFIYRYRDIHYSKQKVTELIAGKKIVWLVTDSQLNFTKEKSEWTGTRICFEIFTIDDKTAIRFTHVGLEPGIECYTDCSRAWSSYINGSLKNLILRSIVN